jgi:hypothetical protein
VRDTSVLRNTRPGPAAALTSAVDQYSAHSAPDGSLAPGLGTVLHAGTHEQRAGAGLTLAGEYQGAQTPPQTILGR